MTVGIKDEISCLDTSAGLMLEEELMEGNENVKV
jgi:hypothetical protein